MNSSRPNCAAMTVNERIVVAGLLGEWDMAINARDRTKAIEVLGSVDLDEISAAHIVDTALGNPSTYGFPRTK